MGLPDSRYSPVQNCLIDSNDDMAPIPSHPSIVSPCSCSRYGSKVAPKVLSSARHDVGEELHLDASDGLAADRDVEENHWIVSHGVGWCV